MKYLTQSQVNYLQGCLKMRGHDAGTLAELLGRPRPTVASNINGNRRNPQVRAEIARFLGEPVERLFGGNGGPGESNLYPHFIAAALGAPGQNFKKIGQWLEKIWKWLNIGPWRRKSGSSS